MVIMTDEPDLFTDCPLCFEPLRGERFFHINCAKRENAGDDRTDPECIDDNFDYYD